MSRTNPRTAETTAEIAKKYPLVKTGTDGVEQVTVVFTRTVQFECAGRKQGPKFGKGREYVFDADFANRWIKRGAAYNKADGAPEPQLEDDEDEVARESRGGMTRGGASSDQDTTGKAGAAQSV